MERCTTLLEHLGTRHLGSVQTAAHLHLDAFGTHAHSTLHCHFDCTAVSYLVLNLASDVGSHEFRVKLRTLDLVNINLYILACELDKLFLQIVYVLTAATDNHTGTRGADSDGDHLQSALDDNTRYACLGKTGAQVFADFGVFKQDIAIFFAAIPVRVPATDHAEAVANRIYFLSHLVF